MDPGPGSRDYHPGRQVENHKRGMENRSQAMAFEKWIDQNRKGGKSVTPFFSEIVP